MSESGKAFKTSKGKVLMFKESGTMRPMDDKPNTDIFKSWAELEREIDASIRYAKNKDQNACSIIEIGTWDQRNNPNLKKIMNKFKEKGYNCSVQPGYFDDDTDDGDIGMTMTIEQSRFLESSKKFGKKFSESEGGVTCHATCVDWDAPITKTFKTLAQCKRWMETTADEIASEWGSMVEGLAVWAEDDELIVISGNGKVVAKFKIVPDYEDFHDPNEYYQESDNKKFGRKFVNEGTDMDPDEAEKQLRAIGDNDPDSIIWILGDILNGISENCIEDVANSILGSVQEPKLAQLTMAIYQNISENRL